MSRAIFCLVVTLLAPVLANALPASTVQIQDAWIRWLPGNLPAGGYLTLINTGDQPVRLIKASSPDYALVSIHRTVTQDGTSQMAPVSEILIPPHSSLQFATAGYHLMLQQPKRTLNPGDHVAVTLNFGDGSAPLSAQFQLRQPDGAAAKPDKSMADMPGM